MTSPLRGVPPIPRTRVEHQAGAALPIVVSFTRAGGLTTEAMRLDDASVLFEQLRDAIRTETRFRAERRGDGH